jgi:hypothetical protein
MSDRGQWFDWIDKNNQEQTRWAINYLNKKGAHLPYSDHPYHQLQEVSTAWLRQTDVANAEAREQLVFRMKAAWSKEKSRKKRTGQKPYSFEMSAQVGPALKRLSKAQGLLISQALESLILNTDAFRRHLEDIKREEVAKIRPSQKDTDRHAEQQKLQLAALKRMTQEWESAADDLLAQGARYQVALKANGLLGKNREVRLEPAQEIAAGKLHRHWKESLTRSIKARTRLARLMLDPFDKPADELQQGIKSIHSPN